MTEYDKCTKPEKHMFHGLCFITTHSKDRIFCPVDNKPCKPKIEGLFKAKYISKKRYKKLLEE